VVKGFGSDYDAYELDTPSRHGTYCFNVFVMMQIFNFINARKLYDQINVFEGILKSSLFMIIVFIIFVLQIVIIHAGGFAFGCAKGVSFELTFRDSSGKAGEFAWDSELLA
jgi:magnesium-transporting ATPase (P-type)